MSRPEPQPSLLQIVFDAASGSQRDHFAALFVLAAVGHILLAVLSGQWQPTRAAHPSRERPVLRLEQFVELEPPAPAPPPAAPEPALAKPVPVLPSKRATVRAAAPELPTAAQAAQVVAHPADAPIDFSGFDLAQGQGMRYAGGVTAAAGTSQHALRGPATAAAVSGTGKQASLARTVGAPAREWNCPWPNQADALAIDEQTVVLRALVREDGSVVSATLVADPGYGFGARALECARKQHFAPATDARGHAIAATSPPVRVHFTR